MHSLDHENKTDYSFCDWNFHKDRSKNAASVWKVDKNVQLKMLPRILSMQSCT